MILDTSFVEDVARQDADALAKADALAHEGVPERLSVMTLYRRSRPSASGLDPEGKGRKPR